ncbi:uncharacterized protein TNCV_4409931 [Trichonephila clavipes]|nr:uncharacterized protein TNCV_4409931 [Trichonephila clavipes]
MYSIEERVFLVLEYHRLQESPTATRRSFQARFNVPKGPDAKTIRTLFAKFQRTGCVTDDLVGNVGRKQTAVTPQNVATVSGIIQQNPMSSVRRTASEAVNVWAAVCSRGIIGPFFIRETVTSERYVTILEQFVATQQVLENGLRTEWFMQDGARPHRTEQVFLFLDEYFGNRVIVLEYPKFTCAGMDWPPYSPDLTLCDYFLWGTLKDIVYSKHLATLDELESAICVACESISVETLRNVMANFILRLRHLSCANGEHFEHIVM